MTKFWDIAAKNLKLQFRDKKGGIMTFLMPIFYYILMGSLFGSMTSPETGANVLTLSTPGFILYGILSSLAGTFILMTSEKKDGLLKRLEVSRMQAKDMILGYMISNTAMVFIQFFIGLGILAAFGFRPIYADLPSLILGVLLTMLFLSFFLNALALILCAIMKRPENIAGAMWLFIVPMMMFSGCFFSLETLTPNLVPYVQWIPTRIVVLIFQDLMINAVTVWNSSILLNEFWLILEGLAVFWIGIKSYRHFVQTN